MNNFSTRSEVEKTCYGSSSCGTIERNGSAVMICSLRGTSGAFMFTPCGCGCPSQFDINVCSALTLYREPGRNNCLEFESLSLLLAKERSARVRTVQGACGWHATRTPPDVNPTQGMVSPVRGLGPWIVATHRHQKKEVQQACARIRAGKYRMRESTLR